MSDNRARVFFEYACHDVNYAMRNTLSVERPAEKKSAAAPSGTRQP